MTTIPIPSGRLHSEFVRLLLCSYRFIVKLTVFFHLQEFIFLILPVDSSTSTVWKYPHRFKCVWGTSFLRMEDSVLVVTSVLTSVWRQLKSGLRSSDEPDEDEGSITRLRFVWFTSNFVHLPPRKPLENRVCHASNFLQFFYPKILCDEMPDEIHRKWCIIRVYKKSTYKSFTQLHLSNWPIRNYSSVQFLSVAKYTGSGLLQSSVTWPVR